MRKIFVVIFVICSLALLKIDFFGNAYSASSTPTYADYFKARDEMIKKMDVEGEKSDHPEVSLKDMLQKIIGPTNVPGFKKDPELSLFMSYDVDAPYSEMQLTNFLQFFPQDRKAGINTMLVTTKTLFDEAQERFKKRFNDGQKDEFGSSKAWLIVADRFDCGFTEYFQLPVTNQDQSFDIKVSVGFCGNDIGAFAPNILTVSVVKNEKMIALFRALNSDEIAQIDVCKNEFSQSAQSEQYDPDQAEKRNKKRFENYKKCFADNAKSQKFYSVLLSDAQLILDSVINSEKDQIMKK